MLQFKVTNSFAMQPNVARKRLLCLLANSQFTPAFPNGKLALLAHFPPLPNGRGLQFEV
ncbi:hypothetical protein [Spirobacillus cienkowskii]|uniref:hypothetical protein n=1 Tax=Spirobacillus cienkowskii TaxID=495820 RepID=UPI0030D03FC5